MTTKHNLSKKKSDQEGDLLGKVRETPKTSGASMKLKHKDSMKKDMRDWKNERLL